MDLKDEHRKPPSAGRTLCLFVCITACESGGGYKGNILSPRSLWEPVGDICSFFLKSVFKHA